MKNTDILISVIVPIYNPGNYLEECLCSLKNQTYKRIEILVIDDGSSDYSSEIAKAYLLKDKRFKYYRLKHGGVSQARNFGIQKANGQYLVFVDGDDYVLPDYIKTLSKGINEETINVCGITKKYANRFKKYIRHSNKQLSIENFLLESSQNTSIGGFCPNKIYSRDTILKKKIMFNETLKVLEDTDFNMRYVRNIGTINYIKAAPYIYRQHAESTVHSSDDELRKEVILAIDTMSNDPNISNEELEALEYIRLAEAIKFDSHIDKHVLGKYILNNNVPAMNRIKIALKASLRPLYKQYRNLKKRRMAK